MSSVSTILQQLGENAGRARLTRGAMYADLITSAANLPGQIMADRDARAIRDATQARLAAQDARQANADARSAKDQGFQDDAHALEAKDRADWKQISGAMYTQTPAAPPTMGYDGTLTAAAPAGPPTINYDAAIATAQRIGAADKIPTILQHQRDNAPKVGEAAAGTMGRYLTGPQAGELVPNSLVPDKPPAPSAATFAQTATDPAATPEARAAAQRALDATQNTPTVRETMRHNAEMEKISRMNAGREDAARAETRRHNLETERASNPFTAGLTGPGAGGARDANGEVLHGEDFLRTIAPGVASEIKAYAEGKRPFPTGMSYAKLQPLIQMVGQYDPTFDAANYNARNKTRTDLTSTNGTGGKTIGALNTALQHAGKLSDLIEKLDNYESPLANAVVNPFRTATGQTGVTNFKAVAPQLMKEIERSWRGTGGSSADIKDLIDSIGQNLGKQQQREALNNFVDLVRGKLDTTQQQRDNAMGPTAGASIPILYEQNKPIMARIAQRAGVGPAATEPGASAAPAAAAAPSAPIVVVDPQGGRHPFATQAQADAFKQLAGIK